MWPLSSVMQWELVVLELYWWLFLAPLIQSKHTWSWLHRVSSAWPWVSVNQLSVWGLAQRQHWHITQIRKHAEDKSYNYNCCHLSSFFANPDFLLVTLGHTHKMGHKTHKTAWFHFTHVKEVMKYYIKILSQEKASLLQQMRLRKRDAGRKEFG